MTLAHAFVSGVVVRPPEKRFTPNDLAIADMTINIDQKSETMLRILAFGNLADVVASTVSAGDSVAVEGKLQVNTYKLPNGKDKKIFEISASAIEKISATTNPVADNNVATQQNQNQNIVTFSQDEIAQDLIDEEEIPF